MAKDGKAMRMDPELLWAIEEAIRKEQMSQVFYTKASGLATSKDVKSFFRELKADEVDHERLLNELIKDLERGKAIQKARPHPVEPLEKDFLQLFRRDIPKTTTSLAEALDIAMRSEEDARKGYEKLAKESPTVSLVDLFNLLAQYEGGHLKRLKLVRDQMR